MPRPIAGVERRGRGALALILVLLGLLLVGFLIRRSLKSGAGEGDSRAHADLLARELAAAYFADDDRVKASEAVAPLVERADPDPQDLVTAATIALGRADIAAARGFLQRAQRLAPEHPRVRYNLGRLLRWEGDYEGALAHLQVAHEEAPADAPTTLMLAETLAKVGRSEEAERLYLGLVDEGVDSLGSWYLTAAFRLSRLAQDRGDDQAAEQWRAQFEVLQERGMTVPDGTQLDVGIFGGVPVPAPEGTRPSGTGELPVLADRLVRIDELAGAIAHALTDVDNDGRLDVVGWGPSGLVAALNTADGWVPERVHGQAVDLALCFDFGNDDDVDFLLTRGAELVLLVTEIDLQGRLSWRPWSGTLPRPPGPPSDLLALDYDHEGDLDLVLVGAFGILLLRDDGAPAAGGGYTDVGVEAGLPTQTAFSWVVSEDFDTDQDVDLLLGGGAELFLATNLRGGRFERSDAVSAIGALEVEPLVADLDADGRPDIWGAGAGAGLWINAPSTRFARRADQERSAAKGPIAAVDFDLDGALDVLWVDGQRLAGRLALALDGERALAWDLPGAPSALPLVADLDGDLAHELVLPREAGVEVYRTRPANNGLRLGYRGAKDNRRGVGAVVELRAGGTYRRIYWRGEAELVGIGDEEEADLVRVTWPNGVIQYDDRRGLADRAATDDAQAFLQTEGLSGSCPFLYSWNGETFEFVSDVLGITPLGLPIEPGRMVPPDHDEYVLVRGEQLREQDGWLELQITEELREVTYLDHLRLEVVDHPIGTEVFPNERFSFPPFPEPHTHTVRGALSPLVALDDEGRDWSAELAAIDGRHAVPFEPAPPQIQGIASPHALELSFDPGALAGARRLRLVMTGWLWWSNASVNVAIARDPRYAFVPPLLQVPDGEGGWRDTGPPVGFPAGKTKSMVIDVTQLIRADDPRIRVFSTLRLYWDAIRLAVDDDDAELFTEVLQPSSARLWRRGFSEPVTDGSPHHPERFEWERVSRIPRWNPHPGLYTRLGDVTPLVEEVDDRFVIMASGDALHVRFDARSLAAPPAGFRRDYLVYLDGWAKDRDPNTIDALRVEPLPFHGMSGYPYGATESFPDDAAHRAWRREWNTRAAQRWLPRLAGLQGEL